MRPSEPDRPRRVVSISLGSSRRDKAHQAEILGVPFTIERQGCDGDMERFARLFKELDGKADALGVGGADIWVVVGEKRYAFRQILAISQGAVQTPVVDGSGLKHTLERDAIRRLQESGEVDFSKEKVLLVSAADRYGMAQALADACPSVVYGDLCFGLGLPIPVRSYRTVERLGRLLLPLVTRLPLKWFYPTGEKQEKREPRCPKLFQEATLIAGDWHYIRRHAPDRLDGKTVLTQTVRAADLEWLRQIGVRRLVTTTPVMAGETFATNVMEGVLTALQGRRCTQDETAAWIKELGWGPSVLDLN